MERRITMISIGVDLRFIRCGPDGPRVCATRERIWDILGDLAGGDRVRVRYTCILMTKSCGPCLLV